MSRIMPKRFLCQIWLVQLQTSLCQLQWSYAGCICHITHFQYCSSYQGLHLWQLFMPGSQAWSQVCNHAISVYNLRTKCDRAYLINSLQGSYSFIVSPSTFRLHKNNSFFHQIGKIKIENLLMIKKKCCHITYKKECRHITYNLWI